MTAFWQRHHTRLSALPATLGVVIVLLALVRWGGSATVGPLLDLSLGTLVAVLTFVAFFISTAAPPSV